MTTATTNAAAALKFRDMLLSKFTEGKNLVDVRGEASGALHGRTYNRLLFIDNIQYKKYVF